MSQLYSKSSGLSRVVSHMSVCSIHFEHIGYIRQISDSLGNFAKWSLPSSKHIGYIRHILGCLGKFRTRASEWGAIRLKVTTSRVLLLRWCFCIECYSTRAYLQILSLVHLSTLTFFLCFFLFLSHSVSSNHLSLPLSSIFTSVSLSLSLSYQNNTQWS